MTRVWRCFRYSLLCGLFLMTACAGTDVELGPPAVIRSVEIVEDGGRYIAEIEGEYPDSCSTSGEVEQEVRGQTLVVTVYTEREEDATCEPVPRPFTDEIVLDVEGLPAGQYTVSVNGRVNTLTLLSDQ